MWVHPGLGFCLRPEKAELSEKDSSKPRCKALQNTVGAEEEDRRATWSPHQARAPAPAAPADPSGETVLWLRGLVVRHPCNNGLFTVAGDWNILSMAECSLRREKV